MNKLIHVNSSVIAAVAYVQRQLIIEFKDGTQYAYSIDYATFKQMLACASIGKYFNLHIRNHYVGRKLAKNLYVESSDTNSGGELHSEHETYK